MNEKYYLNSDILEICKNLKNYNKNFEGKKIFNFWSEWFSRKIFYQIIDTNEYEFKKK